MSLDRPWSLRGRVGFLLLASVALLATSCTRVPALHAEARSMHSAAQALYLWPREEPITYNDIACGGESACISGLTGSVPSALRRPLHLPALMHGRCPTHRARLVAPHTGPGEGPGPVYPVIADPAGPSGVLTFAYPPPPGSYLAGTGFGGQKVLWIVAPRYRGPVLIRGGQLGGHNPVKFTSGTPVLFPELQEPPQSQDVRAGLLGRGWRYSSSGTALRAPGCYAWQIDGSTFSYSVAFRAVESHVSDVR